MVQILVSPPVAVKRGAAVASARRARALEIGLVLGVGVLALLVRFPNHQLIPAFTDETGEIYHGLLIARGEHWPLTNVDPYIGSLWNYLLAMAFWASGFSLHAPRAVALALGVLTVVAAYPLGRAWGGPAAGLTAAALVCTAAGHVAINSHVAWSNSMTPLFTTIGVWALSAAVRDVDRSSRTVLLAGLAWGLALQSHPSVLALLPGAVGFLLWRGRPLLRTSRLYVAAGLFALVNVNLLAHNLVTGLDSVSYAVGKAGEYAEGRALTPRLYFERVGLLLLGLFQGLGGAVDLGRSGSTVLLDPGLWPIAILSVAGVFWQWRRGNSLPGLLLASLVLVLPLFNGKYNLVPNGRYLAPVLPILYAGVGALFATGLCRLRRSEPGSGGWSSASARLAPALLGLAAAFLVLHPLLYLPTYYRQVPEIGWTNAPMFRTVERIEAHRRSDEPVILDRALNVHRPGWGDGTPLDAFELAFKVSGVPYRVAYLTRDYTDKLLDPSNRCRDQLVVLAAREADRSQEIVARLGLQSLDDAPIGAQVAGDYPLYRLARASNAPPTC